MQREEQRDRDRKDRPRLQTEIHSIPPLPSRSRLGRLCPIDRLVVARDWQRYGVEWQAPFDRQPPHIDDVKDRRAIGGEPHREARRAVTAGWHAPREARRPFM